MNNKVQIEDLSQAKKALDIAFVFGKLGYNATAQSLNIEDFGFSPTLTSCINKTYLIANQEEGKLQILLFELESTQWISKAVLKQRLNAIAANLSQRPSFFLILATRDYRQLVLASPKRSFNAQMELQTNLSTVEINLSDPSFSNLHLLQRLAVQNLSSAAIHDLQYKTIAFAQATYRSNSKVTDITTVSYYLRAIGKFKLLTREEEILLARQISRLQTIKKEEQTLKKFLNREPENQEVAKCLNITPDELQTEIKRGNLAKKKLIESNLKLVVSIAKHYQRQGVDLLDLISEGNLGLIKATEKFDYTKGYKFSPYATWWIKQNITRFITNCSRIIRIPVHVWQKQSKIKKVYRHLSKQSLTTPSVKEVAIEMNESTDNILLTGQYFETVVSLDLYLGENQDTSLSDFICDHSENPEEHLIQGLKKEDLDKVLILLTPSQAEVLRKRYGLNDGVGKTLQEIGTELNLTRERIRQIEEKALNKIRKDYLHLLVGY